MKGGRRKGRVRRNLEYITLGVGDLYNLDKKLKKGEIGILGHLNNWQWIPHVNIHHKPNTNKNLEITHK